MKVRHFKTSDFRSMPWKNGRGETLQLVIHPDRAEEPGGVEDSGKTGVQGGVGDAFLWRISAAPVLEACEFSQFPGYDRLLTIWEGEGLRLQFGERAQTPPAFTPLRTGEVCRFSGDERCSCELIQGPVRDFGVIFKRGVVAASLEVLSLGANVGSGAGTGMAAHAQIRSGETHYLFCASGRVCVFTGSHVLDLDREEMLSLDKEHSDSPSDGFQIEALEEGVLVFHVVVADT